MRLNDFLILLTYSQEQSIGSCFRQKLNDKHRFIVIE